MAGAPPPTRTIERVETELGWEFIQIYGLTETSPLLTINRSRAEYDDLTPAERAAKLGRAGGAGARRAAARRRPTARCSRAPQRRCMDGYWEQPDGDRRRHATSTAGSTPATAARSTTTAT